MTPSFNPLQSPCSDDMPAVPGGASRRQKLDPNLVDLAQGVARSVDILEERGLVKPEAIELFETENVQRVCLGLCSGRVLQDVNQDQVNNLRDLLHLVNCMQGTHFKCHYINNNQAIIYNDNLLKKEALEADLLKDYFEKDYQIHGHAILLSSDGILGLALYDLAAQDGWFYERFTQEVDLNGDETAVLGEYGKVRQAKDCNRNDDMRIKHLVVPSAREDLEIWEQSIRSHLDSLKLFGHQNTDFWMFLEREDNISGEQLEQRKKEIIQRLSDEYKINIRLVNMEAKDNALDAIAQQHCGAEPGSEQASVKNQWKQSCLEHRVAGAQRNWYRTFLDQQGSLLCFDDDSLAAATTVQSQSQSVVWKDYEAEFLKAMVSVFELGDKEAVDSVSDRAPIFIEKLVQADYIGSEQSKRIKFVENLGRTLVEAKLISVYKNKSEIRSITVADFIGNNQECRIPVDCCGIASRLIGKRAKDLPVPFMPNSFDSGRNVILNSNRTRNSLESVVASVHFGCCLGEPGSSMRKYANLLRSLMGDAQEERIDIAGFGSYIVPMHGDSAFGTVTSHCLNLDSNHELGANDSLLRIGPYNSLGVKSWLIGHGKATIQSTNLDHLQAERPYSQLARERLGTLIVNECAIQAAYNTVNKSELYQWKMNLVAVRIVDVLGVIQELSKGEEPETRNEILALEEDLRQMGAVLNCDFSALMKEPDLNLEKDPNAIRDRIFYMIDHAGEFKKLHDQYVDELLAAQYYGASILAARRKVNLLQAPYVETISPTS